MSPSGFGQIHWNLRVSTRVCGSHQKYAFEFAGAIYAIDYDGQTILKEFQ